MASQLQQYRLLNRLDLAPSFTSLGLRPELFRDGGDRDATSFDAALSGPGDTLWLFRGEDFLGYDLRQNRISHPPRAIADVWAGGALPGSFGVGIDSAAWAGPGYPAIAYLYRGDEFIRLDCSADPGDPGTWPVTLEPWNIRSEWLREPSTRTGLDFGPAAKLYGLREDANRVHFFSRDGRYARHNLNNGEYDIATTPTISVFPLPPHFEGRVDLAFYGAGAEAEHIFFFCRFDYAQYDIRRHEIVRTGAIEQRFPELAPFVTRPQLFLVEDYSMDTYVGPLALGRLINTLTIPPGGQISKVVVTRIVTPATTQLRFNLLESQSEAAVTDFYRRMSAAAEIDIGVSRPLVLPGTAGASGIWSGEVDALGSAGQLDDRRNRLASSAFRTIATQTRESTHEVEQVVEDTGDAVVADALTTESFKLENPTEQTRQVEFMELLQAYATLLVLTNVRVAYSNGRDVPRIFALQELGSQLAAQLADSQNSDAVIAFIKNELSRIQDSGGDMRAIITDGMDLAVDARVKTAFIFDDVTPPQDLSMFGIIKSAKRWRQPTYQTRPIDVAPEQADAPQMEISRTSLVADPAVAGLEMSQEILPQ